MRIEYLTHASLRLTHGETSLVTDPFYWMDDTLAPFMGHFPPRDLDPPALGSIRYVYSSHVHLDHSHPETLAKIRDRIQTVLLPAERPGLEARFRNLGFSDIVLLENGRTVSLGPDLEVTSIWDDPVDTCLVARMDGRVVLHMNDCLPRLETIERIAAFGLDYAFVLYTSAQEIYPFLLSRAEDELQRLAGEREEGFLHAQLERVAALQARVVLPYSYTLTYFRPDQVSLNGYRRLTPATFRERLLDAAPDTRCWFIQPGDVIDTATDSMHRLHTENYWGEDLAQYLANVARYAGTVDLPSFDTGEVAAVDARLRQHVRSLLERNLSPDMLAVFGHFRHAVAVHLVGRDSHVTYRIDILRKKLDVAGPEPGLEITLPARVAEILLDGIYDPYTLLYLHQIKFKANVPLKVDPRTESGLYVMAYLFLFCDRPEDLIKA